MSIFLKFLDVIHIIHKYYLAFFAELLKRCLWNRQEAHSKSQETNAHVLFARSLQWKSQHLSPVEGSSNLIYFCGEEMSQKSVTKIIGACMMAPFLGGLVDWPLHTSAINAIQLPNKCQPLQLRTNWWCSLATFAQFLSHEQQHFQNLSLKLRFLHFLQKSQTRYNNVTTLPLYYCYKFAVSFLDGSPFLSTPPLSGPSSFGAVKSIKSAMGKSTAKHHSTRFLWLRYPCF